MYEFVNLPLNNILPSEHNTRRPTDCKTLAEDITVNGLLQPIVVCPIEATDGSAPLYEIVAGHRRYDAVKSLGWTQVPCHVTRSANGDPLSFSQRTEVRRIAENIKRQNLSSYELAMGLRTLRECGLDAKEIAKTAAISLSQANKMLMLANPDRLAPEIFDAWRDGEPFVTTSFLIEQISPCREHDAQLEIYRTAQDEWRTGRSKTRATDDSGGSATGPDDSESRGSQRDSDKVTPKRLAVLLSLIESDSDLIKSEAGQCIAATLLFVLGRKKSITYRGKIYMKNPLSYVRAEQERLRSEERAAREAARESAKADKANGSEAPPKKSARRQKAA